VTELGTPGDGYRVHVCFGPNCTPLGGRGLVPALEAAVRRAGLEDRVEVLATNCRARCDDGPSVNIYPGPVFYGRVSEADAEVIVREHLVGGKPVARLLARPRPARPTRGQRYTGRPRRWVG